MFSQTHVKLHRATDESVKNQFSLDARNLMQVFSLKHTEKLHQEWLATEV